MTAEYNVEQRGRVSGPLFAGWRSGSTSRAPVVVGLWPVLLLVTCGRWGAYLGVPSKGIFLTDALLVVAYLRLCLRRRPGGTRGGSSVGLAALIGLVIYAVVRYTTGDDYSLLALRDVVPYLYAGGVVLGVDAWRHSSVDSKARTARLLLIGLRAHLAWCALVVLLPSVPESLPALADGVHIFTTRPDFDGAVIATLVGRDMLGILSGRKRRGQAVETVIGVAVIGAFGSRAGLIALLAVVLMAVGIWAQSSGKGTKRRSVAVVLMSILFLSVVVLPATSAGQRLLVGAGVLSTTSEPGTGTASAGTQAARQAAWSRVLDYTRQNEKRELFGVGLGPNFMINSGGIESLVGPAADYRDVRSPHDYFIGSFARLGLVGLAFLVVGVLAMIGAGIGVRKLAAEDDLILMCCFLTMAILVVSMVGVVLESPFGAVPFFFCGGIIIAARSSEAAQR